MRYCIKLIVPYILKLQYVHFNSSHHLHKPLPQLLINKLNPVDMYSIRNKREKKRKKKETCQTSKCV